MMECADEIQMYKWWLGRWILCVVVMMNVFNDIIIPHIYRKDLL